MVISKHSRRFCVFLTAILTGAILFTLPACTGQTRATNATSTAAVKLAAWRKGVWIQPDGSYTIFTDTHYFVIMASGDPESPNIYCAASQTRFCSGGMARKQVVRVRQLPGGDMKTFAENVFNDGGELPLEIDTTLFKPDVCNTVDGVIYDSITEETDDYILLSTCNGDKEKIYNDGRSAYMPKDGGEFYSYRIETLN